MAGLSVAGLCVQALSSSCSLWLGSVSRSYLPLVLSSWALCPDLVLFLLLAAPLNSVVGLCIQALSFCYPPWLGSVSRPCLPLVLCGLALWLGLVLFLSSSCLGRAPKLCGWSLWPFIREECGRTNSDINADKNSLMKEFALGVKGRAYQEIDFWLVLV